MTRVQMSAILPSFAGFTISQGSFHLRLIKQLGNGAYGVVYLAENLAPSRNSPQFYAVKCLLKHERGSSLQKQQHREVMHHRALSDHPNVVTLHAVIEEEFYTFLVLDLCEGGDLFNAIMDRGAFAGNTEAIRRTFLQIVDAVEACHNKRIYHRDLKPENILCAKDDQTVYLADFGLSTKNRLSTNFGCGSSFYMSPECLGVFHKKTPYATAPSDVWALGTILCNMVTGRNPWHIASPKADHGFRYYLQRGASFLRDQLTISVAASELLARIFTVDPEARITIPELRAAVLAMDSFFPAEPSAPSVSRALAAVEGSTESAATTAVIVEPTTPTIPPEADITEQGRPVAALGFRNESWELRPIALCASISADFMTMPTDAITAAATATCVGTESTFVGGSDDVSHSSSGAARYPPFESTDSLDDIWSIAGPPPVADSPAESADTDTDTDSDSSGPETPASAASDPAGVVPPLTLDGPTPSECDITMAATRLAELKIEKRPARAIVRLFTGMRLKPRGLRAVA
ncbi:Pkinase-domain-containing protein [Trametes meyenii]|nr:Pkinase-domain-containing protein [Trametes meyenii]